MRLHETEHRARAEAAARRTLGRRWTDDRFELELVRESEPRFSHIYFRTHYAAFFTIHERVGTALVATGEHGTRVSVGARFDRERVAEPAPADVLDRALGVADGALRRTGSGGAHVARVVAAYPARVLGAPGHEVFVSAFAPALEGPLHVEIDAHTGEILSWFAPPFLRGSRDGGALGRAEAARRAARDVALPAGSALGRADLEATPAGRLWRLRFDVANETEKGHLVVSLHARTGALVGEIRLLAATGDLGTRTVRERAEAVVTRALPALVGADVELTTLIPGAVLRGSRRRAGWIGTARIADGSVVRVAYADDEVEVALHGESLRARVDVPAPPSGPAAVTAPAPARAPLAAAPR